MELYIQIKNEQAFQHPILGDNFRQAFPDIDTNNLPSTFARFTRLPEPVLGVYELCEGCTYQDGNSYRWDENTTSWVEVTDA